MCVRGFPSPRRSSIWPKFASTHRGRTRVLLQLTKSRFLTPVLAGFALVAALALSGCATTGDAGQPICHAADGSMVPVNDDRCPQDVRDALNVDTPPPMSIPISMANQQYDAENGLQAGDQGFRPY
jgi:hypothetical protein